MKILLCHNEYRIPGGEDVAFEQDVRLLSPHHEVSTLVVQNAAITETSLRDRLALAQRTVWNTGTYRDLRRRLQAWRPDVVHFHNTFPLLSPAAYYACRSEGVPVVQTLHNYRLLCVNALLTRGDQPCEDCLGRLFPYPGVVHGCYRQSRAGSATVALMTGLHTLLGTWQHKVDAYIVLTEFARQKFLRAGLPAQKLHVRPNFVAPDPGVGDHGAGGALFVGRLSPEKGLQVLQAAWTRLNGQIPLTIVGDGPMRDDLLAWAGATPAVTWAGARSRAETLQFMQQAAFLVVPSLAYESFSLVVIEALATGLPVLVSGHGAPAELIAPGVTGLHFERGDAADLAEKARWLWAHPAERRAMSRAARSEYEAKYTADRNYTRLLQIYDAARNGRG